MGNEVSEVDVGTDGALEWQERLSPLETYARDHFCPIGGSANTSKGNNHPPDQTATSTGSNVKTGERVHGDSSGMATDHQIAPPRKFGGRFGDIFVSGEGDQYEVHHIPADSASPLSRMDGPAIKMSKSDHRQTASCGNSREAREFRAIQKALIQQGNFDEAVQMDLDDIHDKFGDKYDTGLSEMSEYIKELKIEGKIHD